jgi:2-keto-4-pentenoate hydratase/2-oxohepta-3-ene-1,7-dioic acid hydratase in catechol pathway
MASVILLPDRRRYTVGKIIGVGQNYAQHAVEMGGSGKKPPVLFLKPSTSILAEGHSIKLPDYSKEVHHEVELALLIGKTGKDIAAGDWRQYLAGAGIALDLTLRDLQRLAKDHGEPWSVSKGFDGACPISVFTPMDRIKDLNNLRIELEVNHLLRQSGSTTEMIYPVDRLIAYISGYFTLEAGDIILTGTPAGVGKISSGDLLQARIEGLGEIKFEVARNS